MMDSVYPWGLGGTYGGNPVACAAAVAVIEAFESENMLEKSAILGEKLKSGFEQLQREFDIVGEVRGLGAMLAFTLVNRAGLTPNADATKQLVAYCHENGLLILSCGIYGNVIRAMPPFVITDEQLEKGFSILRQGLTMLSKQ